MRQLPRLLAARRAMARERRRRLLRAALGFQPGGREASGVCIYRTHREFDAVLSCWRPMANR